MVSKEIIGDNHESETLTWQDALLLTAIGVALLPLYLWALAGDGVRWLVKRWA